MYSIECLGRRNLRIALHHATGTVPRLLPRDEPRSRPVVPGGQDIVDEPQPRTLDGVLKNTIDYMSRPMVDVGRVFGGKPVAIAGATPGPGGTALAQTAWLPVVRG